MERRAQAAPLDQVEDSLDLAWRRDGEMTARGEPGGPHSLQGVGADEVDVVLPQPPPWIGLNGMGHAGTVGENRARPKLHRAARKHGGALASRHKLDAKVGKLLALHAIVAAYQFLTPADDRQRPAGDRPQVKKVAVRCDDLPRHKRREGVGTSFPAI